MGARASIDQPTMSVPDTDTMHMHTLPRHATLMCVVVNSAVSSSGNSYKTENPNDWKVKIRDNRATNCEAGM